MLTVTQGHDHPLLFRTELSATQLHWVDGAGPREPLGCMARCRHRQPLQACRVSIDGDRLQVRFDQPQRAITPGQSVVLYDGEVCMGGGIID